LVATGPGTKATVSPASHNPKFAEIDQLTKEKKNGCRGWPGQPQTCKVSSLDGLK